MGVLHCNSQSQNVKFWQLQKMSKPTGKTVSQDILDKWECRGLFLHKEHKFNALRSLKFWGLPHPQVIVPVTFGI